MPGHKALVCFYTLMLLTAFGCKKNPTGPTTDDPSDVIQPLLFEAIDVLVLSRSFYPVYKFTQGRPEGACDEAHWHSREPVRSLGYVRNDGEFIVYDLGAVERPRELAGAKKNPDPRGCGHGTVADIRRVTVLAIDFKLNAYYRLFGGPE